MSKSINVYTLPDGRDVVIPDEIFAQTKFTKSGAPDRRAKDNEVFMRWLAEQTGAAPAPVTESIIGADVRKQEAQAYAMRVWGGQSESLKRSERIARVMRALEGQSYSTDGIKLPGEGVDDDDWTAEDEAPVVVSFRRSDEGIV